MTRREADNLLAPGVKKIASKHKKCSGTLLHKSRECHFDIVRSTRIEDDGLSPEAARDLLDVCQLRYGILEVLVHKHGDDRFLWD